MSIIIWPRPNVSSSFTKDHPAVLKKSYDHKLLNKIISELINQMVSRVVGSFHLYIGPLLVVTQKAAVRRCPSQLEAPTTSFNKTVRTKIKVVSKLLLLFALMSLSLDADLRRGQRLVLLQMTEQRKRRQRMGFVDVQQGGGTALPPSAAGGNHQIYKS